MSWQVTCECGWRTRGSREEVIAAVQQHGRETHDQDLTEEQVMAIAIEIPQPAEAES